jgi:hypothetical protein
MQCEQRVPLVGAVFKVSKLVSGQSWQLVEKCQTRWPLARRKDMIKPPRKKDSASITEGNIARPKRFDLSGTVQTLGIFWKMHC